MDSVFIWIFLIAQLLVAFLYCFFGFRFFRGVMAAYIFLSVFPGIMTAIGELSTLEEMITILIALGIAALIAFLAFALFKLAIFLCGGILGVIIAMILSNFIPMDDTVLLVVKIALFVVFGIIAYFLKKGIVVVVSSICGAYTFSTYLSFLIENFEKIGEYSFYQVGTLKETADAAYSSEGLWFILPIIMAILGIIIQSAVTARNKKSIK